MLFSLVRILLEEERVVGKLSLNPNPDTRRFPVAEYRWMWIAILKRAPFATLKRRLNSTSEVYPTARISASH